MQIKINYANDHSILIQLFDNPAVKRWFEYFSTKNYNYRYQYYQVPMLDDAVDIEYHWSNIQSALSKLSQIGLDFDLPVQFDYQQSILNKLHRFFTYNLLWYDVKDSTPNPFNPDFKLVNFTKDEWFSTIDPINQSVHCLEKRTILTKNADSINPPIKGLSFKTDKPNGLSWLHFDATDIKQNYEYFNNIHHPHLVTLDASILGKCVLESFVTDDDPMAKDCTGRLGSHGGFVIDTNTSRQEVYESSAFQSWAESYNVSPDQIPYEFPIGHVVEVTFDFDVYPPKEQFSSLEFIQ